MRRPHVGRVLEPLRSLVRERVRTLSTSAQNASRIAEGFSVFRAEIDAALAGALEPGEEVQFLDYVKLGRSVSAKSLTRKPPDIDDAAGVLGDARALVGAIKPVIAEIDAMLPTRIAITQQRVILVRRPVRSSAVVTVVPRALCAVVRFRRGLPLGLRNVLVLSVGAPAQRLKLVGGLPSDNAKLATIARLLGTTLGDEEAAQQGQGRS